MAIELSVRQAAAHVGKSKQALLKAIKQGKISAAKDAQSQWRIDPAELFRVYRPLAEVTDNVPTAAGAAVGDGAHRALAAKDEVIGHLRKQIERLEADKADWRAERDRLLGVIEAQTAHVKALTDARPATKRRWWRWGR